MEYRIGVYDSDLEYADAFMNYVNTHTELPLRVIMFTSEADIYEYVKNNTLDMLLLEPGVDFASEDIRVAVLTEGEDISGDGICKYRSMTDICGQLAGILEMSAKIRRNNMVNDLCGVFYIDGSIAESCYAQRYLTAAGNTVVIRLEVYRTASCVSGDEELFIYYLLSHNEAILDVINDIVRLKPKEAVTVINGPLSYLDIRELKGSDISWFREIAGGTEDCRYIFEMEGGVLNDIGVLDVFDEVYIPYRDTEINRERIRSFSTVYTYNRCDRLPDKIKLVRMEVDNDGN